VEAGLAESNGDAKRKIKQGGVEIDGKKIDDANAKIAPEMDEKILKVGKRNFRKIKLK
jgi:tyrosyl-tRNA synthetase